MKKLAGYIRGEESIPQADDCEDYRAKIEKKLKKLFPSGYVRVYRGFGLPCKPSRLSEQFMDPNALVSFTTKKSTALSFAEERRDEEPSNWGYVIRADIPISRIYFHHKLDDIGSEHPFEKEVICCPYGIEWEVVEILKPIERGEED